MPLTLRGKSYPIAGESGQPGASGRELMAIESTLGVDALTLVNTKFGPGSDGIMPPPPEPGITRAKKIYAVAWIAVSRAEPETKFPEFLDDVAIEEFDIEDEENPTKAASPEAASDAE